MVVVEIGEAADRLKELIGRVPAGEEVVLADGGRPVARLEACRTDPVAREGGSRPDGGQVSGNPDTPDPSEESG
jgi:antitoxin (DNA-binding transcriptional repressor) of toxin-antitoxin stability system